MPNTKAIGVAFADPALDSVTVSGDVDVSGDVSFGASTANTVAFYGATPQTQQAATNQAAPASTAPASISASQWGFSTSTQAAALVNCVIELRAALVNLGLIKGSN